MIRILGPAMLACLLSACAGQKAMRGTSAQSAAIVNQYRQSLTDFAAGQNALNRANEERIKDLGRVTRGFQAEIDIRGKIWEATGEGAAAATLRRYSAVRADDILAPGGSVNDGPATTPPAALKYDGAPAQALVKELLELSEKPGLKDRAAMLLTYFGALETSFKQSVEAAGKKASGTEAEATTAEADAKTVTPATKTN